MLTPLGYLSENSVRTYPFKDGSSLLPSSGGSSPLANDVFLDFQLVSPYPVVRVGLSRLYIAPSGYGSTVTFTLSAYRFDEVASVWVSTVLTFSRNLDQLVENEAIVQTGTYKIKLVPGPGLLRMMQSPYNTQLYTYEANIATGKFAAEFAPSTVLWSGASVTSLTFKNSESGAPVATINMSGDVTLQAGTNLLFNNNTTSTGLSVIKGAGEGLFDPCADLPTDVIKSINGVNGEDFLFVTGDCYKTIPLPSESTLRFEHTCRPKCSSTEVSAAGYYENRLQDGVNKMGDYITNVVNNLKSQIAIKEAAKAAVVISPYIDAQSAKTVFNSRNYESIGVGIYDPNRKKMTVTMDAYFSNGIVDETYFGANPSWTGWVLYDGSPTLHEDNNKYPLPVTIPPGHDIMPLLSNRGVDCRGSSLVNFVVSSPVTAVDQWAQFKLSAFDNGTLLGTAFKYLNLSPTPRPYFNIRSRRGVRKGTTNTYVHTVMVELFDSNPSWSGTTAFSAVVNSVHTVKNPQLRINNGAVTTLTTAGKTIAFSNKQITWPDRAVVTFQLESPNTSAVNISLTMSVGAQQTVMNNLVFS